ncbi:MAG: hypothetical protein BWK80_31480 [Desulfobacteraceae bacterium IS3]|nr:MAG: hypothetical protein BWK80_31480 [Desulfobacteraceae bacterium IS3]
MKALKKLRELLVRNFPEYVDRVILYGSQIDGKSKDYSDYDILVILKKPYDWKLKNEIYDKTWEIDFEYDILTDIRLISDYELETVKGKQSFISDALERGIVL